MDYIKDCDLDFEWGDDKHRPSGEPYVRLYCCPKFILDSSVDN